MTSWNDEMEFHGWHQELNLFNYAMLMLMFTNLLFVSMVTKSDNFVCWKLIRNFLFYKHSLLLTIDELDFNFINLISFRSFRSENFIGEFIYRNLNTNNMSLTLFFIILYFHIYFYIKFIISNELWEIFVLKDFIIVIISFKKLWFLIKKIMIFLKRELFL